MRALALEAPGRAQVVQAPVPEPGPGEVLVRVEGCGVCGSNLPLWEGRPWVEYPLPPGAPGHEGWGVVEALGPGVDEPAPGTRVAFLSGRAFAELDVATATELTPLPPELETAFPAEPVGCAFNVLRRSGVRAGERVGVVGVGFLGALVVALAVEAGARVTAFARRSWARELALRLGAREALAPDVAGDEADFDCVFEAAGVQETLDIAGRLVRVRGRLVVAGYHQDPRTVDMQRWNWRGIDVVNAHERDPQAYVDGMRAAVELVASGRLDLGPLLTHTFPLERVGEAFEAALRRPEGFLKAVVLT